MRVSDAVGRWGEEVAVRHLQDVGMQVVARNWRCRQGELDVVARDGAVLVVVEVKTRSGVGFGTPAEAVVPRKVARLRRLAAAFLAERPQSVPEVRVDVVGVVRDPTGGRPVQVEHLRGVA